jgi:hypothetical protein
LSLEQLNEVKKIIEANLIDHQNPTRAGAYAPELSEALRALKID